MNNDKNISPSFLNKYLRDTIKKEYRLDIDERAMGMILDGIKIGIDRLIEDCYSFKLLGFKFEVYHKSPKIYRDVRTGDIKISKPHYALRIKVPRLYQRKLKDKTRYNSNEKPTLMGLTQEDVQGTDIEY